MFLLGLLSSATKAGMDAAVNAASETVNTLSNVAGDASNGVIGMAYAGAIGAGLHAQSGLGYVTGEVKDLMHMKTFRDEGWGGLASEGNARFELMDIVAPHSQDGADVGNLDGVFGSLKGIGDRSQ